MTLPVVRVKMTVLRCTCTRCGYQWHVLPENKPGKRCPGCKSPYWPIPRGRLTQGRPPDDAS